MGSKKPQAPPPPPPPAPVPKTAQAYAAGDAEMIRRRKGSSYEKSFLASQPLGGVTSMSGTTSFLGGP